MKIVKVQYTVKPEYVEQNKTNIQKVMDDLKAKPIEGMKYSSYLLEDGVSFMHLNIGKDTETLSKLNQIESFNEFRKQLKASEPISPPKVEKLSLVGAGFDLF